MEFKNWLNDDPVLTMTPPKQPDEEPKNWLDDPEIVHLLSKVTPNDLLDNNSEWDKSIAFICNRSGKVFIAPKGGMSHPDVLNYYARQAGAMNDDEQWHKRINPDFLMKNFDVEFSYEVPSANLLGRASPYNLRNPNIIIPVVAFYLPEPGFETHVKTCLMELYPMIDKNSIVCVQRSKPQPLAAFIGGKTGFGSRNPGYRTFQYNNLRRTSESIE